MAKATLHYATDFNPPWAKTQPMPKTKATARRPRADTTPLPKATDWAAIADMLAGKGIPLDVPMLAVDEAGEVVPTVKRFYIRQPTTAEYDDAMMLYEQTERVYRGSPLGQGARGMPVAEALAEAALTTDAKYAKELRALTVDVYLARLDARLRRDRFLTARLLCDDAGPLFDVDTPEGITAWDALPMTIKDAARPVIWQVLEAVNTLPFGWERLRKPASASASGSGSRPTT